jgi:uncharacterized protein (TIGR03382 family)
VKVDGVAAASGTLHTPGVPGSAAARHAVVGVLGDFGTQGPIETGNAARLVERNVEALVTVGDNAYPNGAAAEWDPAVFRPLAALLRQTTFWPAMGDHEYKTPYAQGFIDAFELPSGPQGERYYSFDWGDLHFAVLDSNCITPLDSATMGCDAGTMVRWLKDDLAASGASWKLAVIHRPAVATGHYDVYPQIPAALVPVFQAQGVDLVLEGHNHLYERTWPVRDGTTTRKDYDHPTAPVYVTSGGGGDWLYDFSFPAADWTAYRETTGQHLVMTLDGGTLHVESIRPDGSLSDEFTIVKDVPPAVEDPPVVAPPPPGGDPGNPSPPPGDTGGTATDRSGAAAPPFRSGCSSGAAAGLAVLLVLPALGVLRRRRTSR